MPKLLKPIQIPWVEDNPGDARLIAEMLSDVKNFSFELRHAARLSDGLKQMDATSFDVAILDLTLPDSHGLETVARAKNA